MEENPEHFSDTSWFKIGAICKAFPEDSRTGRNWCADTKEANRATTTAALDEDVKTAALEALVPRELEQYLAMNRARLITYEQVRSEIQAYVEARRSQFAFQTVAAKNTSDPMDVGSFGKGSKKARKVKVMARTAKKEA